MRQIADELFNEDRWVELYSDVDRSASDPEAMTIALILKQR